MKTISKFKYVFLLIVVAGLFACKGETGPAGPAGADGTDGVDGTNGVDGTDGNANVHTFIFNSPLWDAPSFSSAMSFSATDMITDDAVKNDVILAYVKHPENLVSCQARIDG